MNGSLANGRYTIERELGRGGMAGVYLARDEELHRAVAVKVLAEHLSADDTFRARFLREARLAGRLSHPNIVQVYDVGDAGGRPFIVMEYVPGGTLAECGRLPPGRVAALGLQASAGLQQAHGAGLVHRDVKPGNLLLRDDDVLKIADFGIARAAETTRHTQAGTILGTAAYLAPEQIAGEDATPASDLYSLGAVLYELLTGRPPYVFASLADLAAQQADGTIVPVRDLEPSVPAELEAPVMHALAREPRFRPASAADFAHELAGPGRHPHHDRGGNVGDWDRDRRGRPGRQARPDAHRGDRATAPRAGSAGVEEGEAAGRGRRAGGEPRLQAGPARQL